MPGPQFSSRLLSFRKAWTLRPACALRNAAVFLYDPRQGANHDLRMVVLHGDSRELIDEQVARCGDTLIHIDDPEHGVNFELR